MVVQLAMKMEKDSRTLLKALDTCTITPRYSRSSRKPTLIAPGNWSHSVLVHDVAARVFIAPAVATAGAALPEGAGPGRRPMAAAAGLLAATG